jgi:translocation and assembly module TamB
MPVAASAARVTGLNDAITPFLVNVRIDTSLRFANGTITADTIRYSTAKISGTARLSATPANGAFIVTTAAAVPRLAIPGLGIADVNGTLRIASSLQGPTVSGPVQLRVVRLDNAGIAAITEGLPVINADFALAGDRSIVIRSARITSPGLNAIGSGSLSANDTLRATAGGTSRAYGPFTVAAAGPVATPVIDLTLAKPGLGIGLAQVTARLTPVAAGWHFDTQGQTSYGPIAGNGTLRTGPPLTLDLDKLSLAGMTGHGTLVQTAAGPFAGRIDIAGRGLKGVVALSAEASIQRADIAMTAREAQFDLATPVTIDSGELKLAVLLPASGPSISGPSISTQLQPEVPECLWVSASVPQQDELGECASRW